MNVDDLRDILGAIPGHLEVTGVIGYVMKDGKPELITEAVKALKIEGDEVIILTEDDITEMGDEC